ncbi:MAG: ferrous iron transport protein B [Candidatus Helarchaeota archaeon]
MSEEIDYELELTENRYEIIDKILKEVYIKPTEKVTWTDLLDHVLLNKWLAIPIFIAILWAMFQFTFEVAAPFSEMITIGFGALTDLIKAPFETGVPPDWLPDLFGIFGLEIKIGDLDPTVSFLLWKELAAHPLEIWGSFIGDGIISAVGLIMSFVPNIFLLFLFLSFLEDSGYMSRAAFILDRAMVKLGLHGKSVIPMLVGFGCNVPAIMSARTIDNEVDRKITILTNPFISCGARLPVYILIGGFFFGAAASSIIFLLYVLGMAIAIIMGYIIRRFILKAKPSAFIMEFPPYRSPTVKSASLHMWERGREYIIKIFTIILLGSIIIWAITFLPWKSQPYDSYGAIFGRLMTPMFEPLGFITSPISWILIVALIFGFVAKEMVVGVIGVIMAAISTSLALIANIIGIPQTVGVAIEEVFSYNLLFTSSLTAFSYLVFTLLYIPCLATVAVMKKELNSWKWTLFGMFFTFSIAYLMSFLISGIAYLTGII